LSRRRLLDTYAARLGRALDEAAYSDGFLTSHDGARLFFRHQAPPEGCTADDRIVLVLHGISWHSAPYFAVFAHHLAPLGMSVYAVDFRGHGQSGRRRGDLEDPARVMADINAVFQFLGASHPGGRVFVAGKSMGGLFAVAYVAQHQPPVAGLVLTAPGLRLHPRQVWHRQTVSEAIRAILRPTRGAFDMMGWRLEALSRGSEFVDMRRADTLALDRVSLKYLGVLVQANALWQARYPSRIRVPTLIIQGLADQAVLPSGATVLYERLAAADKKLVTFPQMNHNLLWDVDTPRVFEEISRWLKAH
jgi:alpha-beta hydrolase superfamily lysophospholipase